VETRATALTFIGLTIVGLGLILLIVNLVPGLDLTEIWPLALFIVAFAFCLPPIFLPSSRSALSALFIPASVFLSLGLIFSYALATDDWSVWTYAWTLLPAGVGLGLFAAARVGGWGWMTAFAGFWILVANLGLFLILGLILDADEIERIAPLLLIAMGCLLLLRVFSRAKGERQV
jgi:hypothetical protein